MCKLLCSESAIYLIHIKDSLLGLAPSLSLFKFLKVLVMPAVNTRLRNTTTERSIITQWAKNMPSLKAVLMPSKRFFICTSACQKCCDRVLVEEIVGTSGDVRLCPHEDKDMLRLWIAHENID